MDEDERAYWVSLPHATVLLIARGPLVVLAPPIARHHIGREVSAVLHGYRAKGARIVQMEPPRSA